MQRSQYAEKSSKYSQNLNQIEDDHNRSKQTARLKQNTLQHKVSTYIFDNYSLSSRKFKEMVNQRIESSETGGCAGASTCVRPLLRTVR